MLTDTPTPAVELSAAHRLVLEMDRRFSRDGVTGVIVHATRHSHSASGTCILTMSSVPAVAPGGTVVATIEVWQGPTAAVTVNGGNWRIEVANVMVYRLVPHVISSVASLLAAER